MVPDRTDTRERKRIIVKRKKKSVLIPAVYARLFLDISMHHNSLGNSLFKSHVRTGSIVVPLLTRKRV